MTKIHILKGTGENCSCGNCPVLYGGECYTTPENNFLDALGERVAKATVNEHIVSKNDMHKAPNAVRLPIKKHMHLTNAAYDENYYALLPLLYIIANGLVLDGKRRHDQADARHFWKLARMLALRDYQSRLAAKEAA